MFATQNLVFARMYRFVSVRGTKMRAKSGERRAGSEERGAKSAGHSPLLFFPLSAAVAFSAKVARSVSSLLFFTFANRRFASAPT